MLDLRSACATALAAAAVSSCLVVLGGPPAGAAVIDGGDCGAVNQGDDPSLPTTDPSAPVADLQVADAQALVERRTGAEPGAGVRIAVVDSGVAEVGGITVDGRDQVPGYSRAPAVSWYHGTAMAGVIAGDPRPDGGGPVGIAPGATIYDAQFYDTESTSDDELEPPKLEGLVAALQRMLPLVGTGPSKIRIVNLSVAVNVDDERLEAAVRAITDRGAIVVASSGNRPSDPEASGPVQAYENGEDYADAFFPAGYAKDDRNPLVLAAGSTVPYDPEDPDVPDLRGNPPVVLSSAIDVAVPTSDAVSYAVNGKPCALIAPSTSVAAAQVSGILALLMNVHPDDTPAQLLARLEATATGGSRVPDVPDKAIGRGIVQPLAALTRPLAPAPDGSLGTLTGAEEAVAPAALPEAEPDVLRSTRRNAVWWGLFGGGALVIALLLRPVLARRR